YLHLDKRNAMMIEHLSSIGIHVTQFGGTEKSDIGIHGKCKLLTAVRHSGKSQICQCKQSSTLAYPSSVQMTISHFHTRTGITRLYFKKFHSRTGSETIRLQKFFQCCHITICMNERLLVNNHHRSPET